MIAAVFGTFASDVSSGPGATAQASKPGKSRNEQEVGAVTGRGPVGDPTDRAVGAQGRQPAGRLRSDTGDGDYGYDPIDAAPARPLGGAEAPPVGFEAKGSRGAPGSRQKE